MLDEIGAVNLDGSSLERFELLSAYLDGEVNATERKQVEQWLQEDAAFKTMYQKLRGMHTAIEKMPTPVVLVPVDKFADEVFAKIGQRRQFRLLQVVGGTCAAGLVAVGAIFTATFQGTGTSQFQVATVALPTPAPNSLSIWTKPAPLMMTLNNSIVEISPSKTSVNKTGADVLDLLDDSDDI
jgi:hypothetical protein